MISLKATLRIWIGLSSNPYDDQSYSHYSLPKPICVWKIKRFPCVVLYGFRSDGSSKPVTSALRAILIVGGCGVSVFLLAWVKSYLFFLVLAGVRPANVNTISALMRSAFCSCIWWRNTSQTSYTFVLVFIEIFIPFQHPQIISTTGMPMNRIYKHLTIWKYICTKVLKTFDANIVP